eukprot:406803-Pleurochrysis_carterae.AAC.1
MPAGVVLYFSERAVAADKDKERGWCEAFKKAKEASATEAEVLANNDALIVIRRRYGDSTRRLIAMLLTFDVQF